MAYLVSFTDQTGTLDINDGVTYFAPGQPGLAWQPDGSLTFPLFITASSADRRIDAAAAVQGYLDRAPIFLGQATTFNLSSGGSRLGVWELAGGALAETKVWTGARNAEYSLTLHFRGAARSFPYTAFSGSVTGGAAGFVPVRAVPGDLPALVHLDYTDASASPIVRLHWARSVQGMALSAATDYTPWVAATPSGMGAPASLSDSFGGGGGSGGSPSGDIDWHEIARITQPAGTWQRGLFDGFLRANGTGTPLAVPGSLTASVNASTSTTTSTSTTAATTPAVAGVDAHDTLSGNGTISLSRSGGTNGSTIVLFAAVTLNGNTPTLSPSSTGCTFDPPITRSDGSVQIYEWLARNVTSTTAISIVVTGATVAPGAAVTFAAFKELINLGTNPQLEDLAYTLEATDPSLSVTTTDTADQVAIVMGAVAGGTIRGYSNGLAVFSGGAWRQVHGTEEGVSVKVVITSGTWSGFALVLSVPVTTTTIAGAVTYDEPTPGELLTGTYTARVQAIDAARYRGNATNNNVTTVLAKRSDIVYDWLPVTNAVGYAITIQYGSVCYEVVTTSSNYTLTDLTGLNTVSALPATSGAVAPAPALRVKIGTSGDTTLTPLSEFVTDGTTAFRLYRAFGRRPLPPVAPMLASWQPWVIVVEARSANGAATAIEVDSAWIIPADTYAMLEVPGGTLGAATAWHAETHRSGRDVIGWLASGLRLRGYGVPLMPPGHPAGYIEAETAAGHTFAWHGSLAVTLYPRLRTEGAL